MVFSADRGGSAYAFDAADGTVRWRAQIDGAAGGGAISYVAGGAQRVAFVAGTDSPIWPVERRTARIQVFGLPQ